VTTWDEVKRSWQTVREHVQILAEKLDDNLAELTTENDDA